jgi:predicted  nucleic acid-binding Zn-ribbon protein
MGFFIQDYQDFRGNVVELSELAIRCSQYLNLPGDTDKINERTIRYYVTEGLVDRPTRIGRDAEYEYIHLLQFLASRYLVASGYPMAKVAPYIASRSIEDLAKFVSNPSKPNLAELLVASFAKERLSTYPTKDRSPRLQSSSMQSAAPRLSRMQSADDFYETPAFLRKNSDNNSRRSTNIPNLETKATSSPKIQDLFSSEEISQELNAKSISYSEKQTQINTQINAETFAKMNAELKQEISALHHRMHEMQKEFDHAFAKMSDHLQDQIQEQSHRYRKQTDQLHEALQKLQVEIKQSNEQWREEFQELRKYIEHQILPPIEAERASPSSPPISSKNI